MSSSRRAFVSSALGWTGMLAGSLSAPVATSHANPERNQPPRQMLVLLPGHVPYFDAQILGMNAQAQLSQFQLKYLFANWNAAEQIRQLEFALSSSVDGLCVCAVDNRALRVLPELLARKKKRLPVVSFTNSIGDSPVGEFPGVSAYVGRDEVESGHLLGEMIQRTLPTNANARILLVEGAPGSSPQRLRTQGLTEVVGRNPGWEIVHRFAVPGWSGSITEKQLYRLEHLDVNIIATQWADAGAAAARAMVRRPARIPIVTMEYTRELRPYLLNGRVSMTSHHDVAFEGRLVIQTMDKVLRGAIDVPWVRVQQRIIDQSGARSMLPGW